MNIWLQGSLGELFHHTYARETVWKIRSAFGSFLFAFFSLSLGGFAWREARLQHQFVFGVYSLVIGYLCLHPSFTLT